MGYKVNPPPSKPKPNIEPPAQQPNSVRKNERQSTLTRMLDSFMNRGVEYWLYMENETTIVVSTKDTEAHFNIRTGEPL